MNIISFFFVTVLGIITFGGCKAQIKKNNLWIGGYSLFDPLDHGSANPVENNIIVINDSIIHLMLGGRVIDTIINDKSLKNFEIKNDNLILYKKYIFLSVKEYLNRKQLAISNSCWENKDYILCFKDSTIIIKNLKSNDVLYKCFEIENLNNITIMNLFGNKWDCSKYNMFFKLQIVQISDLSIFIRGYLNGNIYENTFKLTNNALDIKNSFNLCNDLIYSNYPGYRYYATNTSFNGGIYNISKIFKKKYKKPEGIKQSGVIRIRFIVNCRGETGRFEMVEMDNNYDVKPFNPSIASQILQICKELNAWIPGKNDSQSVDSYKFLTFKIQDSEIVEIFP